MRLHPPGKVRAPALKRGVAPARHGATTRKSALACCSPHTPCHSLPSEQCPHCCSPRASTSPPESTLAVSANSTHRMPTTLSECPDPCPTMTTASARTMRSPTPPSFHSTKPPESIHHNRADRPSRPNQPSSFAPIAPPVNSVASSQSHFLRQSERKAFHPSPQSTQARTSTRPD